MTDIEQALIRIRLYREGDQYVESANHSQKEEEEENKKRRKRKREDTCIVADEQSSILGEPDFRKVLGYRSP
jgi:hypothetical protein